MQLPEQIESERLIIRVARPGDGKVLNEAIIESLDQLTPWLPWAIPTPTVAESEESCRRAYGRFHLNEDLMALLFLRSVDPSSAQADCMMSIGISAASKSATGGGLLLAEGD